MQLDSDVFVARWKVVSRGALTHAERSDTLPAMPRLIVLVLVLVIACAVPAWAAPATDAPLIPVTVTTGGKVDRGGYSSYGYSEDGVSNVSADGRYVLFGSDSLRLVPSHKSGGLAFQPYLYLRDMKAGRTIPVKSPTGGFGMPLSISGDGRYVTFMSVDPRRTNTPRATYVWDRRTRRATRLAPGLNALVSADSRVIAYTSERCKRCAESRAVFIRNVRTGQIRHVTASRRVWISGLSADGRYLLVRDASVTPLKFSVMDAQTGDLDPIGLADNDLGTTISADGQIVWFSSTHALVAEDTNATRDCYALDRRMRSFAVQSLRLDGTPAPSVGKRDGMGCLHSSDGRVMVIDTYQQLLPEDQDRALDHYVRDLSANTLIRLIVRNPAGFKTLTTDALSADGSRMLMTAFRADHWISLFSANLR